MTVRAAVCTRYGPPEVLQVQDVPKPVPKADELLVRIDASTVTSSDCFTRSGIPIAPLLMQLSMRLLVGVRAPRRRILGLILAGEVEAVGSRVSRFVVGDRVYSFTMLRFGAWAEYTCLTETSTVSRAPSDLVAEEAAAIPYGGLLALHYLGKGGLERARSAAPSVERRGNQRNPAAPAGFCGRRMRRLSCSSHRAVIIGFHPVLDIETSGLSP
jgi:NADPH:quinone reductase-like Zn-dependent oxidoreductase